MVTINARAEYAIPIGRVGEKGHTKVAFDVGDILTQYPSATLRLLHQRAGDSVAYEVPAAQLTLSGTALYWIVSDADSGKAGNGSAELIAVKNDVIVKSVIYATQTLPALNGTGTLPDPFSDWMSGHAVRYDEAQSLTAAQKEQAQENMGLPEAYAKVDGYYEQLVSGGTEQLLATVGVTDKVPYNFRTSGGSADIGDREKAQAIVGGTIAWNQQADGFSENQSAITAQNHGFTATAVSGKSYFGAKFKVGNDAYQPAADHVYIAMFELSAVEVENLAYIRFANGSKDVTGGLSYCQSAGKYAGAFKGRGGQTLYLNANLETGSVTTGAESFTVTNVQIFDLTQMFGAAIANAVYALETANAGAGVSWFRSLFPKAYYAYNAGELLSVNTSAHITVGFNAFDVSTGKAALLGGQEYQITGSYTALSLDGASVTPDADGKFTPAANGELTVTGGDATTCVHLVWSGYRDGDYEPYVKHSYPLDSSLTLRGIPKLDASGSLYYDGDAYAPDGTVTRRYGIVDMGTLAWQNGATTETGKYRKKSTSLAGTAKGAISASNTQNLICSKYSAASPNATYLATDKSITIDPSGVVYVYDSAYNGNDDAAAFTTAMSGMYLVYELDVPTTESADPYQETQLVDDFGTEEYVDARDVAVPVGHVTFYPEDLRGKLQRLPAIPAAPGANGTYALKCAVSGGVPTYSWEAEG